MTAQYGRVYRTIRLDLSAGYIAGDGRGEYLVASPRLAMPPRPCIATSLRAQGAGFPPAPWPEWQSAMANNRRYAEAVDRRIDQRIVQVVMREDSPATLREEELQLDVEPLTRTPWPQPVRAWVRYGDMPVEVDAEVVAWTTRAVAIRWRTPAGAEHRAWV